MFYRELSSIAGTPIESEATARPQLPLYDDVGVSRFTRVSINQLAEFDFIIGAIKGRQLAPIRLAIGFVRASRCHGAPL